MDFAATVAEHGLMELVRFEAVQMARRLPRGYDRDDLESVGNEALMEALSRASAADPVRFKKTVRLVVRNRMKDFIRNTSGLRRAAGGPREVGMPADAGTGELIPLADVRAADPSDIATAREELRLGGPALPSAPAVARKAAELRAALWDGVNADDIRAVVAKQVEKAKRGNTRSAELLVRLLGAGGRSGGVTQTVLVNVQDIT